MLVSDTRLEMALATTKNTKLINVLNKPIAVE